MGFTSSLINPDKQHTHTHPQSSPPPLAPKPTSRIPHPYFPNLPKYSLNDSPFFPFCSAGAFAPSSTPFSPLLAFGPPLAVSSLLLAAILSCETDSMEKSGPPHQVQGKGCWIVGAGRRRGVVRGVLRPHW